MEKTKKPHHSERAMLSIFKKILLVCVSILLLAIQCLVFYLVFFAAAKITWLYILVEIVGFICIISMYDRKMSSSYKLLWIALIVLLPFAGTILYLFCGNERSFPKRKSRKIHEYTDKYRTQNHYADTIKKMDPIAYKHTALIHRSTKTPIFTNTEVNFYPEIVDKHKAMLEDMMKAKKYIFMEYFIISGGKMLDQVIEVLEQKAKEGIEIRICYDDFGSKRYLHGKALKKLKEIPGVRIIKFAPLGITFNLTVNYRDHRKMTIIDGNIAYLGGDNIADEYANYKERFGYWRDNAVRLEGEAVESCVNMFAETWYMSTKEMIDILKYKGNLSIPNTMNIVMPFGDGPTDNQNPAYDVYTSFANNAKNYLYISTPYFIIDKEFINEICNAAKSGVDVKLLIPGIPDKKAVYWLSRSHFGDILKAGGKIYQYTPGFNHAKNYICDDQYAIVGSINVDYRSLYLHFENGVYISNDHTVLEMKKDFLNSVSKSEEMTLGKWKKRSFFVKVIEFVMKIFSPLM